MEPSRVSQSIPLSAVDAMLLEAEAQLSAHNNYNLDDGIQQRHMEGAAMRVLPNGAVEETSPMFDEQGTRLEFIDEAALKHYRDLVQLLDQARNGESRRQTPTAYHTTSSMVATKVTMSSTTQNHITIIDTTKGKS